MLLDEILIAESIETVKDAFKRSKYMSPHWKISIKEREVEWWEEYKYWIQAEIQKKNQEKIQHLTNTIPILFDSKKYEEALTKIYELFSITEPGNQILEIKANIDAALDFQEKMQQAKSEKNYKDLQRYFNDLHNFNKTDREIEKEKKFLDEAVMYLDKSVLEKCKTRKNYQDALEKVSQLFETSPPFYKDELDNTRLKLLENREELEGKEKIKQLNNEIEEALAYDHYDETLTLIKEAQTYLKPDDEMIFSEEKYREALEINREINNSIKNKNYSDTLVLFKKLERLNPYSNCVKEQRKHFEDYFSILEAITGEKSPLNVVREFNKHRRHLNQLPGYLKNDLNSIIEEAHDSIEKEKERLRMRLSLIYKKKQFDRCIGILERIKLIEPDRKKIEDIEAEMDMVNALKKKRKWWKRIRYVTIALFLIFIIFLVTGPITYHINKNKTFKYLEEARSLLKKEKFNDLKTKLNLIFETRKKLGEEKKIDSDIMAILKLSYTKLTNGIIKPEKSGRKEKALENAGKALQFFSGFPGNMAETFRAKCEIKLKKLRYDKYFKLGEDYYRDKKYESAVKNFDLAQKNIPSIEVTKLLKDAKYKKHLEAGKRFYARKNYVKALEEFNAAKENKATYHIYGLIEKVKRESKIPGLTRKLQRFKESKDTGNALLTLIELKKRKSEPSGTFDLLTRVSYRNSSGHPEIILNDIKFVFIEGDEFEMGCFDANDARVLTDALPLHPVNLNDFWISTTEITRSQYIKANKSNLPVSNIDWNSASLYAKNFGKPWNLESNLPTEAQWEYVARNRGKKIIFPWGNVFIPSNVNYKKPYNSAIPVGSFPPNRLGIFDLAGNLREWCRDIYWANYYSTSETGNPYNSFGSGERVVRGGSYADGIFALKTYKRYYRPENSKDSFTGFRIVLEQ